ncbi:MAG: DUF4124 domain-containing protein [Nevskia sp.]|nr:DUF4124 domain-containing protein [Nevskia sp.]
MSSRLIIAVLLLAAASAAGMARAASAYKWIDAQGNTHYDDQNSLQQRLTLKYLNQRAVPEQLEATTPRDFIEAVARDCVNVRDRAAIYRGARKVYGRDPVGNAYRLSARQQALEVEAAERNIQRYCSTGAAASLYREQRAAASAPKARKIEVEQRR